MPGFAPISVSWGWLMVGMIIGVVMTLLILMLTGCLRRDINAAALARVAAAPPVPAGGALATHQPPQEILQYITHGGRPALQELAGATGLTEAEFLQRVFGLGRPRIAGNFTF